MKTAIDFIKNIFYSKSFGFLAVLFLTGTVLLVIGKLASGDWLQLVKWLGLGGAARSAVGDFSTQQNEIKGKEEQIAKKIDSSSDVELAQLANDRTEKN